MGTYSKILKWPFRALGLRRHPAPVGAEEHYVEIAEGEFAEPDPGSMHAPEPPALQPILIPGLSARTGSTVVMQLLGTSPQIAFERRYPFETRHLGYLCHWARALKWVQHPTNSWNSSIIGRDLNLKWIRPFPGTDSQLLRTEGSSEPLWARVLRASWKEYSQLVTENMRRLTDSDLPVLYYAEKLESPTAFVTARRLFGARALHTLRDPRDVVVSMIAFNRKRGVNDMGPVEGESVAAYVVRRSPDWKKRLQTIIEVLNAPPNPFDYVIRYENLMADPATEAQRLGDWLGVELDPSEISSSNQIKKIHMTSQSSSDSVERWRSELDPDARQAFVDCLAGELEVLGYRVR
ncbi:sulfotransferase family protein [Tautonia plasticadhaerens]|uniref:Sulfotransferase domain protein n=1 Tax=Tautonia plasticadhaerens TaxID=2527974 RepID=A0A518H5Z3_9BACT|nr:sulfotransferase [Tautonia plasticadhaerens]QDV36253.1 Sulfotransferase domain protein [Tautonia plasticadhaerens]